MNTLQAAALSIFIFEWLSPAGYNMKVTIKISSLRFVQIFEFGICYGTHLGNMPKKNGFIWDFVPNIGPHPPTARVWDSTK